MVDESIHECPEAKKLDNCQMGMLSEMFSFSNLALKIRISALTKLFSDEKNF